MPNWFVSASAIALLLAITLPSVASTAAADAPAVVECTPMYWGLVPIPHACAEAASQPVLSACFTVYRREGYDPVLKSCTPSAAEDAAVGDTVCAPRESPWMCARASVEDGVCTIFYFDLDPRWGCFDPLDGATTAALPKCVGGDAPGNAIACARYSPGEGVCTWAASGDLEQRPESCWKPGLGAAVAELKCVATPGTSPALAQACVYRNLPGGPCWNVKVKGSTVSDSCAPDRAAASSAPTEGCTPEVGPGTLGTRACWDYNAVNDACVRVYHKRMLIEECVVFVGPPIG